MISSIGSSRVVLGDEVRRATLHLSDGIVQEIDTRSPEVDLGDLVLMPGLVDSHVHVNEPGRTEWEGFDTATRAAAAGGTTTIVDMPLNSIPPTVTLAALERKRTSAEGKLSVDTAFWGGLIPGSAQHLGDLVAAGVSGFKAFLVDSGVEEFPPMAVGALRAQLPVLGRLGVPLLVHAEDPLQISPMTGDPKDYRGYMESRPAVAEATAISALTGLAIENPARIHVLHISSAEAVAAVGVAVPNLTGETCPHYLVFCAEEIPHGATAYKCAPPIRGRDHREALWEGLISGTLSMVVSDHSPAPEAIKETESGDFARAWGGIGSLQLRLPAVWTGAEPRGVGLTDLVRWLATEPAKLAGLDDRKGSIEVGMDADFVAWDPDGTIEVSGSKLYHRHPVTPYEGHRLRGRVELVVLRGEAIVDKGAIRPGLGRMLERA